VCQKAPPPPLDSPDDYASNQYGTVSLEAMPPPPEASAAGFLQIFPLFLQIFLCLNSTRSFCCRKRRQTKSTRFTLKFRIS
jgi:hypothetical protein